MANYQVYRNTTGAGRSAAETFSGTAADLEAKKAGGEDLSYSLMNDPTPDPPSIAGLSGGGGATVPTGAPPAAANAASAPTMAGGSLEPPSALHQAGAPSYFYRPGLGQRTPPSLQALLTGSRY